MPDAATDGAEVLIADDDADLLETAEAPGVSEVAASDLPHGWECRFCTDRKENYYLNTVTAHSVWERPTLPAAAFSIQVNPAVAEKLKAEIGLEKEAEQRAANRQDAFKRKCNKTAATASRTTIALDLAGATRKNTLNAKRALDAEPKPPPQAAGGAEIYVVSDDGDDAADDPLVQAQELLQGRTAVKTEQRDAHAEPLFR